MRRRSDDGSRRLARIWTSGSGGGLPRAERWRPAGGGMAPGAALSRAAPGTYAAAGRGSTLGGGETAISVEAKKKELVGDFKNTGPTWRPQGQPEAVRTHDFLIPELGKAVPYGVYDIGANSGWVSVGIDHDTAAFAVNAIRSWWQELGTAPTFPPTSLVTTPTTAATKTAPTRRRTPGPHPPPPRPGPPPAIAPSP